MKKFLDFKSIAIAGIIAGIIAGSILYHVVLLFSRGSFTIDSKPLFGAFSIMVLWCLIYMVFNVRKLKKTVEQLARANEDIKQTSADIRQLNEDMKQILETIVENQLEGKLVAEKLHRNTRVMLYKAITEGGSNDSNKKRIKVVGRK